MVEFFSIKTDCFEEKTFETLKTFVSEDRRQRIKRFMFQKDSIMCLLGDVLARYAICRRLKYKNNQLRFALNQYNKPHLDMPANVHYNVSHSGDWVVCVLSNEKAGIDVEKIKKTDFDIAKRFFTANEYLSIMSQPSDSRVKHFFRLWTLKESYIKADGRGLSLPLDSFSIDINQDLISVTTDNELKGCCFKQFDLDDEHLVSICALENNFADTIQNVTTIEIINTLRT